MYANSLVKRGILEEEITEDDVIDDLKECGLSHLLKEIPNRFLPVMQHWKDKRLAALEGYLESFEKKRLLINERLKGKLPEEALSGDYLPVGSWVRVYRPATTKLGSYYTLPKEVIGLPSRATREVRSIEGKSSLEYIGNLIIHRETTSRTLEN